MVHVRVSDDYVSHSGSLFVRKSHRDTAGIDGDTVVDEETSQSLFEGCVTLGVKGAW